MEVLSNILDPTHDTLASEVWDHPAAARPKLKKAHRLWIWHTVTTVLERHGYHGSHEWLSLVLTGSLTTYQYSDQSDCDVSLFVDVEVFPEWSRAEMIGLMVEHVDGTTLPHTPYAMQCFVVPKEIKKADLYKPGLRSGYDLATDEWIEPPDHSRTLDVERQMNESYVYAMECADKMERLLKFEPERAEDYWHQVHQARRRAQQEGRGDYSLPNIVYKFLANRGLFPQIADLTGEYIARTAATWDPETSRWVSTPEERAQINPEIVHPHWPPTNSAIEEMGEDDFARRVPVIFTGTRVHLGNPGDMHEDIYNNSHEAIQGHHGAWLPEGGFDHKPGDLTWFDATPKPEWDEAIRRKLNVGPAVESEGDWKFDVKSAVDPASLHQQVLDANRGQNLQGLPGPVNVPGAGRVHFHSNADIQRIANDYNQRNGLGAHPTDYVKVNPQHAAAVAQEYERMPHNPQDPEVQQAYGQLAQEVRAQYDHAVNNGYKFEFYPQTHDPYPNSPREAVLDLHHNKHMYVYPTVEGFGSGDDHSDHPLMGDSGVRWGDKPVTHNDLFRAIHDFYGHAKEGLGFRADGEDNAYRQHAAMFTPLAQRALASETRGQNHWVNYGPHGEHNQTATHDTIYADQKAGLMPEWTSHPDLHKAPRVAAHPGKARGVFQDFRPNTLHPPGPDGPEHPFIYDPAQDLVVLGPVNALHWELIKKTPELRDQYADEDHFTAPSFTKNRSHIPGRLVARDKTLHFLGGPYPREVRERINNTLGGPPLPPEDSHEDDPFGFEFPTA